MTRDKLISMIMREVRVATEDEDLRRIMEWKLKLTKTQVLQDIYSTNAVARSVERAKELLKNSNALSG